MSGSTVTIWVLEDDATCREIVRSALPAEWTITEFESLGAFDRALKDAGPRPNVVIADVRLEDANFLTWLLSPEAQTLLSDVPFLVVSGLDERETIRAAFQHGAVDFLSKPFGRAALAVKVERILAASPSFAGIAIDGGRMEVRRPNGQSVELTVKEMQIVSMLWSAPEHTLVRHELRDRVWPNVRVGRKTLGVHLTRLRKKLDAVGVDLQSVGPDRIALVVRAGGSSPEPPRSSHT
jgi:two-component system response regulator AdeR